MANKLYEEKHIQDIANAIRGKTGKTDSLLVSAMAEEIAGITTKSDPILQDKIVTENGEYSADEGYDGLGTVTVDVIEDLTNLVDLLGDGEVIKGGSGDSGSTSTYADQLYEHFEIDKGVYPYVFLAAYNYGSSKCTCIISFGTGLKSGDIGVGGTVKSRTDLFSHFAFGDVTSLDYLVNVAMTQWKPSHLTDKSSSTIEMNTKYIYATNYEISETNISKLHAYYSLNQ